MDKEIVEELIKLNNGQTEMTGKVAVIQDEMISIKKTQTKQGLHLTALHEKHVADEAKKEQRKKTLKFIIGGCGLVATITGIGIKIKDLL